VIQVWSYEEGECITVDDPAGISDLVEAAEGLIWVDLTEPTESELHLVADEFALHPLALEDASKHGQRAKLEQYPTHAFVVAYSSSLAEVDLFFGPTWLVTVRDHDAKGEEWDVTPVRERYDRTRPGRPTIGFLVYTILDELVDGYFDATDAAEDRLEELEDRIFGEDLPAERDVQQRLFEIRRELVVFRRAVVPLREVVGALLRREVDWIDDETVVHLQDVYDHVLRAIDLVDGQRELMGNAVDAHLAIISNRMNQVMKKMTSWGAILLGSTLIAGIYGMNFKHMPELQWRYGYPWALGLMLLITIVGWWSFKRRDWL
jgi:magnesium transporter